MTIGELARAAGVPVSTIRYYERAGLLAAAERSESGYRHYGAAELERLRLLRMAQNVGLTLEDADLLLRLREHSPVPKAQVDELVRSRLARIDEQIAQLHELRCVLLAALHDSVEDCECSKCDDLQMLQQKISGNSEHKA